MATEQAYYALTAYFRMVEGKTSLYNMTDIVNMEGNEVVDVTADSAQEENELISEEMEILEAEDSIGFYWWIIIAVLAVGVVVVVAIPVVKKRKR